MSVGRALAVMVAKGICTLEDLDQPTKPWGELEEDRADSARDWGETGWSGRRHPAMPYPNAGTNQPPRNLAREWIAANPKESAELTAAYAAEREANLAAQASAASRR